MSNKPVTWNVRRKGYAWRENAQDRYFLAPEKIEMIDGKLFWSHEDRITMLALLLENVGVDAAIRIGDQKVWKEAIADL